MTQYILFLDGALHCTKRLKTQIAGRPAIAADGGIRHARALDITPQLWLGDFDSAEPALLRQFSAVEQSCFPAAKDETDGELAVNAALARGATELILCGAFGGERPDHALLHMNLSIKLRRRGIDTMLTDGKNEGTPLIAGNYSFSWPKNTLFSLVGMSAIEGLSISGAKWNLDNRVLEFGSSLALSNESCGIVRISISKGYGILLAQLSL